MSEEPPGVVFLLISPAGRILLQCRDQDCTKYPGWWCFPGGACEPGEEFLDAVVREAREEFEAVVDPSVCSLLMSRLGDMNKVFVCPVASEEGLTLHEGADMRWYSLEEIKLMKLGFQLSDILPELQKFVARFLLS